jgi:hypothetical protein
MIRRVTLFFASSAVTAALVAGLYASILPRGATEGALFSSETALWMTGLLLLLFGLGSALGSLDLLRTPFPGVDAAQIPAKDVRRAHLGFAAGSWWVATTGILVVAVAVITA